MNKDIDTITSCLDKEVELEGGTNHPLEELEELRLTLKSFLNTEVLDSLLTLYKGLSRDPVETEMYSWFVRNSQYGAECKYARQALERFKKNRLERIEGLLEKCLTNIRKIKN